MIIGLITIAFTLLYVAVSYVIGFPVGVVLELTCFILLLAILRTFQVTGRYRLCANLYLANCFFVAILGCSFFSGGIHSMVTPWFVLAPITSVLLRRSNIDTIVWVLLTCTVIVIYGLADMLGFQFPVLYNKSFKAFFNTLSISGLALILSWIALMFGRNRNRAMVTIFEQKASLQRALAEIEQLAYHDVLTQLPNRRLLLDRLSQTRSESKRNGCYAALMFIDLDNFKSLNDTHGHEAGDLLLTQAAQRLIGCMREMDTVARFGGDEFAVILNTLDPDFANSQNRASIVAEKISASLAEPYHLALPTKGDLPMTVEHRCTASIGVVLFLGHAGLQKELLIWADEAMYKAKSAGNNSICFHSANVAVV